MTYKYKKREVKKQPEKEFLLGNGRISGYISALLGGLSLIAVLAYLSIPG